MTVADPHGEVRDILRSCYASWMNTPDAGRIRVRWYRVRVDPGVYELTDYSSSNWDEDPKDYDPEIGEESTSRTPFTDWRDCSPPPWGDDCFILGCQPFGGRSAWRYRTNLSEFTDTDGNPMGLGPYVMSSSGACDWLGGFAAAGPPSYAVRMFLDLDSNLIVGVFVDVPFFGTTVYEYIALTPVDMTAPFTADFRTIIVDQWPLLKYPPRLRLVPWVCLTRLTESGKRRLTENGNYRITEAK